MHLTFRNVNDAFHTLVRGLHNGESSGRFPIVEEQSRNGRVLRIDEPVLITYTHPRERVLFNAVRDANPFFHLYEALWMLTGRNDVAPLTYYCSRMKDFSDNWTEDDGNGHPGGTLNGAYGWRWRKARTKSRVVGPAAVVTPAIDQLNVLVNHLKVNPASRRAVLQMWTVYDDLLKIDSSKDVCCNLSVMFSLREGRVWTQMMKGYSPDAREVPVRMNTYVLDMTVTNRSNDLLWGVLGANYVHFTFLQEYMAARLGVEVGRYHHFTNNLHVYCDRPDWKPEEMLNDRQRDWYGVGVVREHGLITNTFPFVKDSETFEQELPAFVEQHSRDALAGEYREPFLAQVAQLMCVAFHHYKRRDLGSALQVAGGIQADDWRIAAVEWLRKRQQRRESRVCE